MKPVITLLQEEHIITCGSNLGNVILTNLSSHWVLNLWMGKKKKKAELMSFRCSLFCPIAFWEEKGNRPKNMFSFEGDGNVLEIETLSYPAPSLETIHYTWLQRKGSYGTKFR